MSKPELFYDDYLFDSLEKLYQKCFNSNCDECEHRNDFDKEENICYSDVIMELWRRLDNAEEANKKLTQIILKEKQQ